MRRPILAMIPIILANSAIAEPSLPGDLLSVEEMRAELFGVHLHGYHDAAGYLWDECIEPDGDTVYATYQNGAQSRYSQLGGLEITEDAFACFSYPPGNDPDPSCFRVMRTEDGYAFQDSGGAANFITTLVETGVSYCPEPGSLTS